MKELFEVIESYNNYIVKVPKGAIYLANCFREDKLQEALSAVTDFSEGVIWLSDVADLLNKSNYFVELNIEQIHEFLIEINEALEKQDYILVADLFEYEISPFFEQAQLIKGIE